LVTPFVVTSECPEATDRTIPQWAEDRDDLRFREEKILEKREVFRLETVDHGQVLKYLGDRSVETAKNCLQRVGSHSRDGFGFRFGFGFGFGEQRLKPLGEQSHNSEREQLSDHQCSGKIRIRMNRARKYSAAAE
jgi:hypothetical protein